MNRTVKAIVMVASMIAVSGPLHAGKPVRAECSFDFEASFDDLGGDALRSDEKGSYPAIGGQGFRLDTNGSQKSERTIDDRRVWIDFSVDPNVDCDTPDANDPSVAAGFCTELKGIDLRFEHQVQELPGLCSLGPDQSMLMALRVAFLSDPGGTLRPIFKNGRDSSEEQITLNLTYGCLHPNLEQGDIDPDGRAEVTRVGDANVWRIEATRACLHTNLGQKLQDVNPDTGELETVYLQLPFGLTIVAVDSP